MKFRSKSHGFRWGRRRGFARWTPKAVARRVSARMAKLCFRMLLRGFRKGFRSVCVALLPKVVRRLV